jgi:hypothetical protein
MSAQIPDSIRTTLQSGAQTRVEELLAERRRKRLCTPPNGADAVTLARVRAECEKFKVGGDKSSLIKFVGEMFSNSDMLNFCFLKEGVVTSTEESGMDLESLHAAYGELDSAFDAEPSIKEAMLTARGNLVKNLKMTTATHFDAEALESMRQFMFLLLDPNLMEYAATEELQGQVKNLCECMTTVPEALQDTLVNWFKTLESDLFEMMHHCFHTYITVCIASATESESRALGCVQPPLLLPALGVAQC